MAEQKKSTRKPRAPKPKPYPIEPPEHLPAANREVWVEVVARDAIAPTVDAMLLEAYCDVVVQWRAASKALADDGVVIANDKGNALVHPALDAQRQLAKQLETWAPLFSRPPAAVRKRGPMYDATKRSIDASPEIASERFDGPKLHVLTYAWLIDEAAREGIEAIRKASYVTMPSYLKGCAELQITPASVPAEWLKEDEDDGTILKFEQSAAGRRKQALSAAG